MLKKDLTNYAFVKRITISVKFFPGKITDLKGDTVCVSCLQKAWNYFKYPITTDIHWYPVSDIIATLLESELKNTRRFFGF